MNEADRRRLLLAGLSLWPLVVRAQSTPGRIWRCGNTYSDHPCGHGSALDLEPGPDAQARSEADAATRRVHEQADAMARERERREAAAARQGPAVIPHPSAPQDPHEPLNDRPTRAQRPATRKGRSPQNDHFTVRAPREDKAGAKVKTKRKDSDKDRTKR